MKTLLAAVIVLVGVSGQAVAYTTYGNSSCRDWIQYGKISNPVQRWQVEQWATGFLSGASYAMDHPIRDTDFNSIKAFIDQYCAKNPLNRVSEAVGSLILELDR